jgi:hypothetical protein
VDDVLGQVVLATGDEDLGAADLVAAVGLRLGLGADDAQVGTGVRLGQAHGTGPDAGIHVRQVLSFSSSLAWALIDRQAPAVSIGYRPKARLEALTISSTCAEMALGMPMPP